MPRTSTAALAAIASVALVGVGSSGQGASAVRNAATPDPAEGEAASPRLTSVERARLEVETAARAPELDPSSVTAFLGADRAEQSRILNAAGIVDPGGSLSERSVQQYLLGQWYQRSGRAVDGAKLVLLSDLAPTQEATAAIRSLDLDDFSSSESEAADTILATGLSPDAAQHRASLQNLARHVRPLLSRVDPGHLGLWIEADHQLVYATTDAAEARSLLPELGLESDVDVRPARFSEADLLARAEIVIGALSERGPADTWTVGIDPINERVVATVTSDDARAEELSSRRDTSELIGEGTLVVNVIRSDEMERPATIMQGGRASTTCTWGFSVQTSTDSERITTAAHCGNTQAQQGINLVFLHQCQGTTYSGCDNPESDAQEHNVNNTNDVAAAQVRLENGSDRAISAVTTWSQMDVTDVACHQGKTTGYSCGFITDKNKTQGLAPGANQFVEVTGDFVDSSPGDSGGPFLYGQSALGLLSTTNDVNPPGNLSNFNAISFAEPNLDVTVKTK